MSEVTQLPEGSDAVELLLRFARAGHGAGYPTAELEDRLLTVARALGVRGAQVSATPTLVELSVGSLPAHAASRSAYGRPPSISTGSRSWTAWCRTCCTTSCRLRRPW